MRAGPTHFTQNLLPFNIIATKNRLHRTPPFFLKPYRMAEGASATNIPAPHPIQSKPDAEKKGNSPKEIPPPPEKPDPGDCCGSGCVRCVWDVYYEELEEYNKLYNHDGPNPKP
ncbi:uncharacterized protein LOC113858298 [Abrus precatorius]|uniref:Uncharacterized protein LOC113858298 n=1 Tax=Abrus precatorius TaxID=3816 RepID=A0A8B8KTL1_ABRPR|nr:uncharacterized protein LOC113858298 [Abrus precatorius]